MIRIHPPHVIVAAFRSLCIARLLPWLLALSLTHGVCAGSEAVYRLDVENTWSTQSHPGLFPEDAHFSWLGGGVHNADVSFWEEGGLASLGMKEMAETGVIDMFVSEVDTTVASSHAMESLAYRWWFCPDETNAPQCGEMSVEFEVSVEFPLVTLVTMLGPSPDWFVGVSGLSLRQNEQWTPEIVVDLLPYDAGTRSANQWQLFGPENDPPEPIQQITSSQSHLVGPTSLGTMTFTLVSDLRLDCDENGAVDVDDLRCVTLDALTDTLSGLNLTLGDFDASGEVEFNDFLILSSNYGSEVGGYVDGDADLNGTVDFVDFLVLSKNYGSASTALVPEPVTNSLPLMFVLLCGLSRSRRNV